MLANATHFSTARAPLAYTRADRREANEHHTFASIGDVFVVIWHKETRLEAISALARSFAAFAAQHPDGACLFTIVEENAELPSNEARQALASFMKNAGSIR